MPGFQKRQVINWKNLKIIGIWKGLIFLEYLDFQIIKFDGFYEIVLIEACFGIAPEIGDGFVKPDGGAEVEFRAGFLQGMEHLVCPGVRGSVFDHGVL